MARMSTSPSGSRPARIAARWLSRRAGIRHRLQRRPRRRVRSRSGADRDADAVVPYGVDPIGSGPSARHGRHSRRASASPPTYLLMPRPDGWSARKDSNISIDAMAQVPDAVAGACRRRHARATSCGLARRRRNVADRVRLSRRTSRRTRSPRSLPRPTSSSTPSVRDDAGNVDGLPNVVMEALASGTPLDDDRSRRHWRGRHGRRRPRGRARNGMPSRWRERGRGADRRPAVRSDDRLRRAALVERTIRLAVGRSRTAMRVRGAYRTRLPRVRTGR